MNISKILALFSLLQISLLSPLSSYSQTVTIPNVFTAGTAAKAADVNANFNTLAAAINALSARVGTQTAGGSSGTSCSLGQNNLGLTYTPTNNAANTFVSGRKLASFPIIDLADGSRYAITFPSDDGAIYGVVGNYYAEVEVTRANDASLAGCSPNIIINGYNAYLTSYDSYNFNNSNGLGATGKTSASITIIFGGSKVTVNFSFINKYISPTISSSNTTPTYAWSGMDYVINFPWAKITPLPSTFTSQLQALVNSVSLKSVK